MKQCVAFFLLMLQCAQNFAQCSLCTKSAQQLGPQAATGLNTGILYMMVIVISVIVFIVYKLKKSKSLE